MKYLKSNLLAVILLISAMIFAGCESTNDPVEPVVKDVNAPTNLMANAKDDSTIVIKFTASTSKDSSFFKDYVLYISPGMSEKKVIDKSSNMITISGLQSGTLYTFEVAARNTKDKESAKVSVSWATATRFTGIKLYETNSSFGSGLELFNTESQKPETYKIANSDKWDLALDTKNESFDFGAPTLTSYNIATPRTTFVKMRDSWIGVNSIDDIFDTEMLDPNQAQLINFNNVTKGFAIAVKTQDGHFAKVFVKAVNGVILQGAADNRYIEVDISYQKTANLPYAKVKPVENDNNSNGANSSLKVSNIKKNVTE